METIRDLPHIQSVRFVGGLSDVDSVSSDTLDELLSGMGGGTTWALDSIAASRAIGGR
jgi:hypothetical protein